MKARVSLEYFVKDCLWNYFFAYNLPKNPFKLFISVAILIALGSFTQFQSKIRAIKLQKCVKIPLTW